MHHVTQFKPVLYGLLLLGICGFAMGAESMILFFLGSIGLLVNAGLVWRGWFRPMPRLAANLVTIAALIYVIHDVLTSGSETVMLIGEFLLFLQMVKLWEQRANRDYAQLLVLSLLLMVAAAINTPSVFFGLLMIFYLILSLYCCVLFHLKVESDAARAAISTPSRKISPAALRQDERKFAQSMRKLTAVMSAVGLVFAVAVFILFPRGTGAGMVGAGQFKATKSMVGFSDQVSFQKFSQIQQNDAVVAFVKLAHNGQYVSGGTLLLRGVTLDAYKESDGSEKWCWVRSPNNTMISGKVVAVDAVAKTLTFRDEQGRNVRVDTAANAYSIRDKQDVVVKKATPLGARATVKIDGVLRPIESLGAVAANSTLQLNLVQAGGQANAVTIPAPVPARPANDKTITGTFVRFDAVTRAVTLKNQAGALITVQLLQDGPVIRINNEWRTIADLIALPVMSTVQLKFIQDGGRLFEISAEWIPPIPTAERHRNPSFQIQAGEEKDLVRRQPADAWEQTITLEPTGTDVLFAMAGPCRFKAGARPMNIRFSRNTGELRHEPDRDTRPMELKYVVTSSNDLGSTPPQEADLPTGRIAADTEDIRNYIHDNKVAGSNGKGLLDDQRRQHVGTDPDELDEQIAQSIEAYLKDGSKFQYTLDLSGQTMDGRDPLIAFVRDFHEGHCQYFAGAMTLMCQSLGMKARMCLGFRCNEFGAGVYIVRQSHAHAWVEVLTKSGWKTFDPTSEADSRSQAARDGFWHKVRLMLNIIQFNYGNSIIAFSNEDRSSLFQRTQAAISRAASTDSSDSPSGFRLNDLWNAQAGGNMSSGVSLSIAVVSGAIALGLIVRYVIRKRRLRQCAERIGLAALPRDDQRRLARQLAFYDDLMTLLARHRIQRQKHQTPLEFSKSLLFLPAEAYEVIVRLTSVFYRVRYGTVELTPARQRLLGRVVERLAGEMPVRQ